MLTSKNEFAEKIADNFDCGVLASVTKEGITLYEGYEEDDFDPTRILSVTWHENLNSYVLQSKRYYNEFGSIEDAIDFVVSVGIL